VNFSASAVLAKPRGSQKPTGGSTPNSFYCIIIRNRNKEYISIYLFIK
jgi:hypothetical protein